MATKKGHLSVAQPGERRPEPKNISDALDGTGRDVLVAMRRALARKLDAGEVSSNAIASAYKELRELDRLIRQADADEAHEEPDRGHVDDSYDASAI